MTGLRESKKQHTRERIASEAMRLFATRGFDHVTVAEVAEAAEVSEKTVFNYFPTKEDLFFDEVPARAAAFAAAIREREPGRSAISALRRLQDRDSSRLTSAEFATFARIIEESPALRAKELEVMRYFAETLAETLRTELRVSDLDARIAASALVGVHAQFFRLARQQALAGKHGPAAARKLRADLARAYELLEHGLGSLEDAT
ncbi:MAG TPA: TetR family transcriptional regulator [Gaiellaceae bacterium]